MPAVSHAAAAFIHAAFAWAVPPGKLNVIVLPVETSGNLIGHLDGIIERWLPAAANKATILTFDG